MSIFILIVVVLFIFLAYQIRKAIRLNKTCLLPFPIWLINYINVAPGAVDKATLANSLIRQVLVVAEKLKAFTPEEYLEISRGFKGIGPEESIRMVDEWIEVLLPRLEREVDISIVDKSSARYVFLLMIIVAGSVNPRRAIREFLEKQKSMYFI